MGLIEIAALLLGLLLVLLCFGVWIGVALAIVGWFGLAFFGSSPPDKNLFTAFWNATASWELAALPMFIWMGEILFRTKLSEEMFEGLSPWLRRIPGRLLHVNILACGLFGSVSGSSAATTATVAKVALPELLRRGYDERVAIGSLATAGGLGILIPPSITMVVYAVAADASIMADLFAPRTRKERARTASRATGSGSTEAAKPVAVADVRQHVVVRQPVAVDHGVRRVVFDPLRARPHQAWRGAQVVGIHEPFLGGDR